MILPAPRFCCTIRAYAPLVLSQLESELAHLVKGRPTSPAAPSILDAPTSPDVCAVVAGGDVQHEPDLSWDDEVGKPVPASDVATPVPVDAEFASSLQLNPLFRCFGLEVRAGIFVALPWLSFPCCSPQLSSEICCATCGMSRKKTVFMNHFSVEVELPAELESDSLSTSWLAQKIPTLQDLLAVELSPGVGEISSLLTLVPHANVCGRNLFESRVWSTSVTRRRIAPARW
jgi:hypothetical protein